MTMNNEKLENQINELLVENSRLKIELANYKEKVSLLEKFAFDDEPSLSLQVKFEDEAKKAFRKQTDFFGPADEIANRMKAQIALKESEEKYRTLVNSAQDSIFIIQHGIIVFANHVTSQITGYSFEDIINQPFSVFVPSEKRGMVVGSYQRRLVSEKNHHSYQTEIITKSGERKPVEIRTNFFNYLGETAELVLIHDISDRVEAEKARENEILLLRTLINHLPSSIFVLDNQYRKTVCNEAHLRRIENTLNSPEPISENEIIGKTNWDVYPKPIADQYYEEDKRVIENGETIIERESCQTDRNGRPFWETISKIPMRQVDGSIIGMLGIAHDITRNKLAEIAVQESEERYRFLFEKNPALMLIYERNSLKLMDVNEAFLSHYGYEKQYALSMYLFDLYPEEEKESIIQLTTGLNGYRNAGEWHHIKSNGEIITIVANSNDIVFESQHARVVVLTDITDRKLIEGKLKASEEKFRLISNSAHDGIFMLNEESQLIYWNPAVEKIFEYPGEELAFKDINELLLSPDPINQERFPIDISVFARSFNVVDSYFELEVQKPDGSPIQVELSLAPMKISEQWGAVGIVRDITERKMVEKELIMAKERAEESDRLKSAFLATMSHELRTPLNAVIGFSSLIDDTMEVTEILDMVKIINDSGNHLLNIIDSVFSLALLQAGEAKVFMEDIPLQNFLTGLKPYLVTKLENEKKKQLIRVAQSTIEDSSIMIRSDKTKLTQMMVNFFDNAIKYTLQGSIEYGCTIEGNSVIFYVKDTGIGIPENKQSIIFERFRQVEDSLTREYGGVGLGLSICKEISDLLKGKIGLESKPGEGSVFYFSLEGVIV